MKQVVRKLLLLLTLTLAATLGLHAEEKETFFVRIVPQGDNLIVGDSMLVSVVLYASHPIAKAESNSKFDPKGAKCSVRKLPIDRDATASRVREGRNIYYTLVWNEYVVAPKQTGKLTIPAQKFTAILQQVVRMPDLFGQMMGERPEYKTVKVSAASKPFTIEAKERPLRSTQEMLRQGSGVL